MRAFVILILATCQTVIWAYIVKNCDQCENIGQKFCLEVQPPQCLCKTGYVMEKGVCREMICRDNPCGVVERCKMLPDASIRQGQEHFTCECVSEEGQPKQYGNGYRCYDTPCYSSPCMNNGKCVKDLTKEPYNFRCTCPFGFIGDWCEHKVLPCDTVIPDNYCKNGGTCKDNDVTSKKCNGCDCLPGFTGATCNETALSCTDSTNPCQNNASCFPYPKPFACKCKEGYAGFLCEINLSTKCKNNGTCVQTQYPDRRYSTRTCTCLSGFSGDDCSTIDLTCSEQPCKNGGMCVAEDHGKFKKCECTDGFRGIFCSEKAYQSYINYPRIHFSGILQLDPSTVNNYRENYDNNEFTALHKMGWNPLGSGNVNFITARVVRVCYIDETCTTDDATEPLIGAELTDGVFGAPAKLVNLDPDALVTDEIFGWKIEVQDFFKSDFEYAPFQNLWPKLPLGQGVDKSGASCQSVLTNLVFGSKSDDSTIIKYFKENLGAKRELSIRFNLDMYNSNGSADNYTFSRIVGSIGISGHDSPPYHSHDRLLKPFDGENSFTFAPFFYEKDNDYVLVDLGNSLQIQANGDVVESVGTLRLGLLKSSAPADRPSCSDVDTWFSKNIDYSNYLNTSWISNVEIDDKVNKSHILDTRVVLAQIDNTTNECKKVVLAEEPEGICIRPVSRWIARSEAEKELEIKLFVTRYGQTPGNTDSITVKVASSAKAVLGTEGINNIPELPSEPIVTALDKSGTCIVTFQTGDPQNIREYIDGQVYGYQFYHNDSYSDRNLARNSAIIFLVWNKYPIPPNPNWMRHISPIFQQYANLYPVMRNHFVNLGNYYDVVKHKQGISMSMQLDVEDTNYMPVVRDLSPNKRITILNWLSPEQPYYGFTNLGINVDTLKNLLQMALQLEHATIPPYLAGLVSIKKGYNTEARDTLQGVVIDEMYHLAQVANIINAIEGNPNLFTKGFVLPYPAYLPAGVQPGLKMTVNKISQLQIRSVYMGIEQPHQELQEHGFMQIINGILSVVGYLSGMAAPEPADTCGADGQCPIDDPACEEIDKKYQEIFNDEEGVELNHNTIGQVYMVIVVVMTKLHCDGKLYFSQRKPQLVLDGLVEVTDYKTAIEGIMNIVTEGEGASPCNPLDDSSQLSHYYKFSQIANRMHVKTFKGKEHEDEACQGTFSYTGKHLPFNQEGVWPTVDDPHISMYKNGSKAKILAVRFRDTYSKLLRSLQNVFDGNVYHFDSTIGVMKDVLLYADDLVQTPIEDGGDPDVGPNAGLIFPSSE